MADYYEFDCGCKIPIDPDSPPVHGRPSLIYRVEDMPLDCPKTWDLICSGRTRGLWQLESNLGRHWSKEIAPRNIEHLAAVVSLLRPGCLRAKDERGVSMTELYARRKNGVEEVSIDIEVVRDILEPTYDVITYQEQFMQIAQIVAGFNLVEVDRLRKSAGKKDPKAMSEVGELFVQKAEALGVITKEQAEFLFGNIKKSARYSFNKCVSFDTRIMRTTRDKHSQSWSPFTVEEMYRIRHDGAYAKATGHDQLRRKWKRIGNYGKGLSLCDDGRVRPNIIADIQPAGVRTVYRLALENGSYIRVTNNHKFPTTAGELTVSDLCGPGSDAVLDYRYREVALFVRGGYEQTDNSKFKYSSMTRDDLRNCPTRGEGGVFGADNYGYTNGSWTQFSEFKQSTPNICFDCGKKDGRIECHHIDGDRTNSDSGNLVKLCASCHKKREYAVGRTRRGEKGYPVVLVRITSILEDGECMTYDVTMDAPNHTFVNESGIVTCNSHAVSYATDCYLTAHEKAHFPVDFFTAYLAFAKDKPKPLDEIRSLVNEAKLFDIEVKPPRFSDLEEHFSTDGVEITFGLADVKGVGDRKVRKMAEAIPGVEAEIGKPRNVWSWFDFLVYFSGSVDAVLVKRMIEVGALRDFRLDRVRLLAEFDAWRRLTDSERAAVAGLRDPVVVEFSVGRAFDAFTASHPEARVCGAYDDEGKVGVVIDEARPCDNLIDALGHVLGRNLGYTKGTRKNPGHPKPAVSGRRRDAVRSLREMLINPPAPLVDKPYWIAGKEEEALGVPLTCSHVDAADKSLVNATCKDFRDGVADRVVLGVEVQEAKEVLTKVKREPMAFLTVADGTGSLDNIVIFPEAWKKYGHLLAREKTIVAIRGNRDPTKGGLIVEEVWGI